MSNELDLTPEFTLFVFDEGSDLDIAVFTPRQPDIRKHASLGMLYGLAILTLDSQGTIQRTVDHFLTGGPMNEVECQNAIALLLKDSENEIPT